MSKSIQQRVVERARTQLGVTEQPPGSNHQKYGQWYGNDYQPWCASFVTWLFVNEGSKACAQGSRWAYCPYWADDARAGRYGLKVLGDQTAGQPGDIVLFDWENDGIEDHVGIIEKNLGGGTYQTIEGNVDSQVARHTRDLSTICMIIRHPGGGTEGDDDVPEFVSLSRKTMTVDAQKFVTWTNESADDEKVHDNEAEAIRLGKTRASVTVGLDCEREIKVQFCKVEDNKVVSVDTSKVGPGDRLVTNDMRFGKGQNLKIRLMTTGDDKGVRVENLSLRALFWETS